MSKSKMDIELDGKQFSEAQKKQIMSRMKRLSEKTFELEFDRTASIYNEQERLETPGGGGGGMRIAFAGGGTYYKNIADKRYLNQTDLFGKLFLISDDLKQWDWKLGSETKKIGDYTCYKAMAVRMRDTTLINRFRRFGRRGREAKVDSVQKDSTDSDSLLSRLEKEPMEDTITAWFSPDIPVSQGPGPYWGLPGLIMEVNDGTTVILCTQIVMNAGDAKPIEAPRKGKEVSQQEFNDIRADKLEEMKANWESGNRREGDGFRIRIKG